MIIDIAVVTRLIKQYFKEKIKRKIFLQNKFDIKGYRIISTSQRVCL